MSQFQKKSFVTLSLFLGVLCASHITLATNTYDNKKTTTVEQTTVQTTSTAPAPAPVKKAAPTTPLTTTTTNTTTLTTKPGELRKVLDEAALKKMSDSLCVKGFKPYVGNDTKNVCQGLAVVPDLAYSCVWTDAGSAAFAPTVQGPCTLEYAEHKKSLIITKTDYSTSPPLPYGTEAQCCFRAAQGPATSSVETSPTTTIVVPKK